ncbi:alcohol dehydrogenase [Xylariaceae sp. FL0594]|nr:alcohol dehydrogenase [Xylariaceae sp. FL0594]
MATPSLPKTMRAIVQTAPGVSSVRTDVPVPSLVSGSAIVKPLAAVVTSNLSSIYRAEGVFGHPDVALAYPRIPGPFSIGRVAALSADAVALKVGDLVMTSTFLTARDEPSVGAVWNVVPGFSKESRALHDVVTAMPSSAGGGGGGGGHYAEYVRAPLENVFKLDEARLLGSPTQPLYPVSSSSTTMGLGYKPGDLVVLAAAAIAYAGLRRIDARAGERVVVTPATGHYSTAAVDVAVAMGLRVVAASRSAEGLAKIRATYSASAQGIETVQLTGDDLEKDVAALQAFGPVDAAVEVSPPAATGSTNFAAAIRALRHGGRIALIGGRGEDAIPVPYFYAIGQNLLIRGSYMYDREDVVAVIRLAEAGLLRFGERAGHVVEGVFGLDQLEAAIEKSVEKHGPGCIVYIQP